MTAEQNPAPLAQPEPLVWVSKWVDYSNKFGFGYQLSSRRVAVLFNNGTHGTVGQQKVSAMMECLVSRPLYSAVLQHCSWAPGPTVSEEGVWVLGSLTSVSVCFLQDCALQPHQH